MKAKPEEEPRRFQVWTGESSVKGQRCLPAFLETTLRKFDKRNNNVNLWWSALACLWAYLSEGYENGEGGYSDALEGEGTVT